MHPTVVSDKPGDCPICGMKLVPIGEESKSAPMQEGSVPGLTTVTITPSAQQRMGLTFGTVEKRKLAREVRTSARLLADETRLHHVTSKVEGWIDELFVAVTGQEVKEGQPLFTLYSPELVTAQEEYLIAKKSGSDALVKAAERRLEFWDVSKEQIEQLERSGEMQKYVTFHSHVNGVVLERNILPGHKVMANEPLMTIADLSTIWADADLYESDLPYVKVGEPMKLKIGDRTYTGKIAFVSPTLDPSTRIAKARLEIPNPELVLKPEMYGTAKLSLQLGERLAVPESAVMRTGDHTYAFKAGDNNALVPVAVKVGARSDDWVEVTDGLSEGDKVVTSANFLVDSESSMKAALAGMAGHQH